MSKKTNILLVFFSLGFFSLLSQTLIIREFLISFGSSELGIGLFLSFWLFWVGVGALFARTKAANWLIKHFLKILVLYPIIALLQIIIFINLRSLSLTPVWEFFAFDKVLIYVFIFSAPLSILTGFLFTSGISWLKQAVKSDDVQVISSAYAYESLGSFFAGIAATFFIMRLTFPADIILPVITLFLAVMVLASFRFKDKSACAIHLIVLLAILPLNFNSQKLTNYFQALRLNNLSNDAEFKAEVYTPYAHAFLAKLNSQLLIYSSGELVSSYPEVIESDKFAAILMAQADLPKDILILGDEASNLSVSLLKFSAVNITHCVSDRVYHETVDQALGKSSDYGFDLKRYRVVYSQPKPFLREVKQKFDLIVVTAMDPSTLILNRFFTKEFYNLAKNNLTTQGILATQATTAPNYLDQEIANYGASLYHTLNQVFDSIVVIPMGKNLFFAGGKEAPLTDKPEILEERLKERIPKDFHFSAQGFESVFLPSRIKFVKKAYKENPLFKNGDLFNSDQRPLAFFLNLLRLCGYSRSFLAGIFKSAYASGLFIFIFPFFVLIGARIIFISRIESLGERRRLFNAKAFQFFSGFLGFSFHLTLIFIFQNLFSTIFQFIGGINALFMFGLFCGSVLGKKQSFKISQQKSARSAEKSVISILTLQVLMIALVLFGFRALSPNYISVIIFIALFFLSGIITGASYPLSAHILCRNNLTLKKSAAALELLDHWGGALAGLVTGIFMLPVLGVKGSLLVMLLMTLALIVIFKAEIHGFFREKTIKSLTFPYIRTSYVLAAICLIAVVNFYLLNHQKKARFSGVSGIDLNQDCVWDERLNCHVCDTDQGRFYNLESKHFAPDIYGYSGPLNLLLRIDEDNLIQDIKVISHSETPSYVQQLPQFLAQFHNKGLNDQLVLGVDIDAITSATVTSEAVLDIVRQSLKAFKSGSGRNISTSQSVAKYKFGKGLWWLLWLTLNALLINFFSKSLLLRKFHLISVVIILGFWFNLVFSSWHLSRLLMLDIFATSPGSTVLVILLPLILGLFFGQFWCGWLCPFGAFQELLAGCGKTQKISPKLDLKARYFKYIFLSGFILLVVISRNSLLFKQDPLVAFFADLFKLNQDKLLAFSVLFFSIFFARFWCRYFCVCGAFLSFFNRIKIFKKSYKHE